MHLSLSRAFQRHQEHDLKHPSLVDLITTKQNKLPSFMDRYKIARFPQQVLAGSQNIKKGFIKKLCSYLACSQIWLKLLVDDLHFVAFIQKIER
jgi:hypothetical protein